MKAQPVDIYIRITNTKVIPFKGGDNTDNKQLQIPTEVRSFLENLLKDAGMTTLDDTMREEMIKELFARLDSYITSVIIDNLPAEELENFIKLNEEKKPREEVEQYLKDKMPNVSEVFAKAFADFREMYLENVTVARSAPAEDGTK